MSLREDAKRIERHLKGAANHYRILIMLLLSKEDGLSLDQLTERLDTLHTATLSEHTRRLADAGLVNKTYKGKVVLHSLSPYGKRFIKFINTFRIDS